MLGQLIRCWSFIESRAKAKMIFSGLLSFFLNILDLIGVALLGLVGSILIRSVQGQSIGDRTSRVLSLIGIEDESTRNQIIFLSIASLLFLVFKSACSYLIIKRVFLFMSNQSNLLSKKIMENIVATPLNKVNMKRSQEYVFIVNRGTGYITMGVLATAFTLITDVSLLASLVVLLLVSDLESGLITTIISLITIISLFLLTRHKSLSISKEHESLGIENNQKVIELFSSFREVITRNTSHIYVDKIYRIKNQISSLAAEMRMMPIYSKFVVETLVLFSFLAIVVLQFAFNDPSRAIGNLVLFLGATSRMTPAILRIQQGLITINNSIGASLSTVEMLLEPLPEINAISPKSSSNQFSKFIPRINFREVSFSYSDKEDWSLVDINLEIHPKSFIGIVGPSGSGKSTLVDLLFGLIEPTKGEVLISGISPRHALSIWSGKFAYVPQASYIFHGSVFENLLMGLPSSPNFEEVAISTLKKVGLWDFINALPGGINFELSEGGSNLSGGQRQKLGIARALMTTPEIIVMDESTSNLDAQSEEEISKLVRELKNELVVIVIAHRLSAVRTADLLIYMDRGKIVAQDTFDNLKKRVPNFQRQAEILGNIE